MTQPRTVRWLILGGLILAIILVPFFIFGSRINQWVLAFTTTASHNFLITALVICGLLASDILLPIPSSIVSTSAGFILDFPAGFVVSFAGMTIACLIGYWLGAKSRRGLSNHVIGTDEMQKLEELNRRFGDWFIVTARAIPVLAEASVLFAGIGAMPFPRFFILSTMSNAAISAIYAAAGAYSSSMNSFLLAFVASILLPMIGMILTRKKRDDNLRH